MLYNMPRRAMTYSLHTQKRKVGRERKLLKDFYSECLIPKVKKEKQQNVKTKTSDKMYFPQYNFFFTLTSPESLITTQFGVSLGLAHQKSTQRIFSNLALVKLFIMHLQTSYSSASVILRRKLFLKQCTMRELCN